MLRFAGAFVLLVTSALAALFVFLASRDDMLDHTIANSNLILKQFELADAFGADQTGNGAYQVREAPIDNALCDETGFQNARKAAGDKTLLTIWRGEWMECYSPVSKTSTLTLERNAYSAFGTLALDRIVFGIASVLSFLAAIALLLRRPKAWFKSRSTPQPTPEPSSAATAAMAR